MYARTLCQLLHVLVQHRHTYTPTYLDADVAGAGPAAGVVGQQDVLWLQVSVDDAFASEHAHSPRNLLQEDANGVLSEGALRYRGERESERERERRRDIFT